MLRSMLYVPAHSERFIGRAHERGADAIILDLEDSVPEADKDRARDLLGETVPAIGRNGAQVFVRINAGERQRSDAHAAAKAGAYGLVVPKAQDPNSIELLAALPVLALIEDPAAVLDARAISAHPRVIALSFGGLDFTAITGGTPSPEVLRFPALMVHYAAKGAGKLSLGLMQSVADYSDLAALEAAAREARQHGFDGATCVHPTAVPILNAAFSPTADEIAWAERVLAAGGEGAFVVDGRMVDAPVIARARAILGR
jgi:citrate lyase subunit beta / citryl-CoA lyase